MPRGGKRPGAGRKKGTNGLAKEEARRLLRELVIAKMQPMTERQIEHAMGIKFMMVRSIRGGKWTRVTQEMADKGFHTDAEVVEVYEKDPSIQAYTDLMNRALDKPSESIQADVRIPGVEGLLERLLAARKRVNG